MSATFSDWEQSKVDAGQPAETLVDSTEVGDLAAYASTPGEFAARWNARTSEERAAWLHVIVEALAPQAIRPVAYLVAERRDGKWIIGDDWSPQFDTLADAQAEAQVWRDMGRHDPEDVAVLVVTVHAGGAA